MRLQGLILISTVSLFFIGCNDDVGSNRNPNPLNPETQTAEKVTTYSGIHRTRSTAPITYAGEITLGSEGTNIRNIPDISLDDEGGDGKNTSTRTSKLRPTEVCGIDKTHTLKQKIEECATKNSDKASWDGKMEAGSAEGTWKLVTLAEEVDGDDLFEIWIDTRTNMLWSDILVADGNWCEASGSQLNESDVVGVNCAAAGKGISLCTNYLPAQLPKVNWRLPTRADYLQADLDGNRFVLNRGNVYFWTATISSDVTKRDKAWVYNMVNGTLTAETMTAERSVRCIGTSNF